MNAYMLGAFAVAVGGILALQWMILRAVTVLSLAHRGRPIPPPTPPPPPPREERETERTWPQMEPQD